MGRCCYVTGCTTGYYKSETKLSLFQVPKDIDTVKKWQRAIPRFDKLLTKSSFICELHFSPEMISRKYFYVIEGKEVSIDRGVPKLNDNAVPCIFPNLPYYLTKVTKRRKSPTKRRCEDFVSSSSFGSITNNTNVSCAAVETGSNDKNLKDNQFTSSLRKRINKFGIPTIFPRSTAEESLKRLNTLIKELEDTNAALNQGIDIAEVDFGTYSHIKKEVDETAVLTFENIAAEDGVTYHDCKSGKIIKNPNIITYEEITSEDMMDMKGNLISKQNNELNNTFEEKHHSLAFNEEIKLKTIEDEDKFKSIQEQFYSFSGITSGDDCDRKYEFEKINPILKMEIEDDVKLEMGLIENIGTLEKIKDEIQMWDEVNAGDDRNLSDDFEIKEDECEDISEVNIKMEEVFDDKETISSTLTLKSDATYKDIPFLTYQISKQNNLLTSENNFGRSVSRKENHISKIGSYEQSASSEISYNKKVYQTTQAATNKEAKSLKRSRSDRFSNYYSSANENINNLVHKVNKKNSDQGNAGITENCRRSFSDPYEKCLEIPVDKNIVFIKLKPFKRKKKTIV